MTIHPEGESIRKAVKWISDCLEADEGQSIAALIQQAASRFDISPKEEEFLFSFFRERKARTAKPE